MGNKKSLRDIGRQRHEQAEYVRLLDDSINYGGDPPSAPAASVSSPERLSIRLIALADRVKKLDALGEPIVLTDQEREDIQTAIKAFEHIVEIFHHVFEQLAEAAIDTVNKFACAIQDLQITPPTSDIQISGMDTDTHWANGQPRLLTSEAYERYHLRDARERRQRDLRQRDLR